MSDLFSVDVDPSPSALGLMAACEAELAAGPEPGSQAEVDAEFAFLVLRSDR